jgi:hypothetical protein
MQTPRKTNEFKQVNILKISQKIVRKIFRQSKKGLGEFGVWVYLDIIRQLIIVLVTLNILLIIGLTMTQEFFGVLSNSLNRKELTFQRSLENIQFNTTVDPINLGLLISGICALIYTANQLHYQQHQDRLKKASYYLDSWHSPDLKDNLNTIRKLKEETFDLEVRKYFCHKQDCQYFTVCHDEKVGAVVHECPYCELSNLSDTTLKISDLPSLKTTYWLIEEGDYNYLIDRIQTIVDKRLNQKDSIEERRQIKQILDLFEHMGQDVKFKVADERFLKDMFFYVVINYYEIFAKYIASIQLKYNNETIYCNLIYLAKNWEEWRKYPRLPFLCPNISQIQKTYFKQLKYNTTNGIGES